MALGSLGLSRPCQAWSEGVLPSCRHTTAPEPLMLFQQRDEGGKAQESIGSWAFPTIIAIGISLSSSLHRHARLDRASSSSSKLVENA